jgi:hypothetical protein
MRQRIGVVLLAACAGLVASSAVTKEPKEIKAVVHGVDATAGTITVLVGSGAKTQRVRTFNLARPDLPVTDAAGQPLKLTDLHADQRVFLKTAPDEDIVAIRLAPPTLFGTIAKVNAAERTVVLRTHTGEKTVAVPAGAAIVAHGQAAKLADLKPGTLALVSFTPDRKTVRELRTGQNLVPLTRLVKSVGILIDVDRDRRTLDVLLNYSSGGDTSALRRMALDAGASFALLDRGRAFRELTFDELARGVKVTFFTEVDTKKVSHVDVEMPFLGRRTLKAFDAGRRRLVLEDADGERVLELSERAKVRTPAGPGRVEDLRPGLAVSCGLSPDRRRLELVQVLPP